MLELNVGVIWNVMELNGVGWSWMELDGWMDGCPPRGTEPSASGLFLLLPPLSLWAKGDGSEFFFFYSTVYGFAYLLNFLV